MGDILRLFGGILDGASQPYEHRKIGRDASGRFVVSTVDSPDLGYETALCDKKGAHPVERYDTLEEAEAGHKKWVSTASTLTSVKKLGYGELVDDKQIELVPLSDEELAEWT